VCGRLVTAIVLYVLLFVCGRLLTAIVQLVQLTGVWTFGNGYCAVRAVDWCVDVC